MNTWPKCAICARHLPASKNQWGWLPSSPDDDDQRRRAICPDCQRLMRTQLGHVDLHSEEA